MIRYAIISCWHVHVRTFVPAIREAGNAELVELWDSDAERGRMWAERYGVPFEPDLDKVLARDDIQAVLLECATTERKDLLPICARAGKHIFTDKALDLTPEGCLELKKICLENNVKLCVAHEYLCASAYRFAKEMIDSGKIGRLASVYFRRVHDGALPRADWLPPYWYDESQTGGGACLDLGCHGFYLLDYFCGKPKRAACIMTQPMGTGMDENVTSVFEFDNGVIGTAHTSFLASYMNNTLEIIGSEGVILVTGLEEYEYEVRMQSNLIPEYSKGLTKVEGFSKYGLKFAPVQFFDWLNSGASDMTMDEFSPDRASATVNLINLSYESDRTSRIVDC